MCILIRYTSNPDYENEELNIQHLYSIFQELIELYFYDIFPGDALNS